MSGFPGGSDSKESACNAGDPGLIPRSGRSPGEGNGNPLQDSCLENPMDRGAWWATVHGLSKSQTRLSNSLHSKDLVGKWFSHPLEEGMAPTPVFLSGESPWTEEPGGLQPMGSQRVRYH